jgi:hypothetical protein
MHGVERRIADKIPAPVIHQRKTALEAPHVLGPGHRTGEFAQHLHQTFHDPLEALLDPFLPVGFLPLCYQFVNWLLMVPNRSARNRLVNSRRSDIATLDNKKPCS